MSSSPQSLPQHVTVHLTGGPFRRLFGWAGWIGLAICTALLISQRLALSEYFDTSEGITEKFHSGAQTGTDKIAIIRVQGAILSGEGFVKKQIDRVRDDDRVKAIIVRVDSPGGTITASDYLYHHLTKLRAEKKVPMIVSMGGMAASGGYYISMAVGDQPESIFAEPTTTTGSIGVIVPHYDVSGLLEQFNVQEDSIVSHPRKQLLSMTRTMSAEDREILQSYVNEAFDRFKDIVRTGRPAFQEDAGELDQLATGEIFTANQALKHGLVDKIGFIEDAVERAQTLAGLDKGRVRVVQYERPATLFELPWLAQSQAQNTTLATLFELQAPQAYYLATTMPPLLSTRPQSP
jgi:protease-4